MGKVALALTAVAAWLIATPAAATTTITDYTFSGTGIAGTYSLACDESLDCTLSAFDLVIGSTTFDTSNVTLVGPIIGGNSGGPQVLIFGTDDFVMSWFWLAPGAQGITTLDWVTAGGNTLNQTSVTISLASAATTGVPEPAAWAMMLLGFAGMGLAMRRRRRLAVA